MLKSRETANNLLGWFYWKPVGSSRRVDPILQSCSEWYQRRFPCHESAASPSLMPCMAVWEPLWNWATLVSSGDIRYRTGFDDSRILAKLLACQNAPLFRVKTWRSSREWCVDCRILRKRLGCLRLLSDYIAVFPSENSPFSGQWRAVRRNPSETTRYLTTLYAYTPCSPCLLISKFIGIFTGPRRLWTLKCPFKKNISEWI